MHAVTSVVRKLCTASEAVSSYWQAAAEIPIPNCIFHYESAVWPSQANSRESIAADTVIVGRHQDSMLNIGMLGCTDRYREVTQSFSSAAAPAIKGEAIVVFNMNKRMATGALHFMFSQRQ